MRKAILVSAILILLCASIFGRGTTAAAKFEVTSVKPTPPERQNRLRMDYCRAGGAFAVGGVPVIWSIAYAYHLKEYQIAGAHGWLNAFDSAYDIEGCNRFSWIDSSWLHTEIRRKCRCTFWQLARTERNSAR